MYVKEALIRCCKQAAGDGESLANPASSLPTPSSRNILPGSTRRLVDIFAGSVAYPQQHQRGQGDCRHHVPRGRQGLPRHLQ